MIIVTGTKRSGTSMWMQVLKATGLQLIGEAFPKNWQETIGAANPHGFYESPLRRGVFYATNPDPRTGLYLAPQQTENLAVKVFIPGLCRTDLAYVGRVVATMRHWREYAASVERLRQIEAESLAAKTDGAFTPLEALDPVLEWWLENFALIRDIVTRKYPALMVTYESVITSPETVLPPILKWLGAPDIEAGLAAVSPETKTQDRERLDGSHECQEVFDELYDLVLQRKPVTNEFLERINETHEKLIPAIEADVARVVTDRRRRAIQARMPDALHPDTLEALIHQADSDDQDQTY